MAMAGCSGVEQVGGMHVRDGADHRQQFGQADELRKACVHAVAVAVRSEFNSSTVLITSAWNVSQHPGSLSYGQQVAVGEHLKHYRISASKQR
jgi:hypothetical protein